MRYYSPIADLISSIENSIPKDQYFELTRSAEDAVSSCNLITSFINEIALECDFSDIENGANKLAQINIHLSELAHACGNISAWRSNHEPSAHSQVGGGSNE